MIDRNFKLGDLDCKISDLGLDCYWTDFKTKEKQHMWLNHFSLEKLTKIAKMTDFEYQKCVLIEERQKKLKKLQ